MATCDAERFFVLEFEEIDGRRNGTGSLYVTDATDASDAVENVFAEMGHMYLLEAQPIDQRLPRGYIVREARLIAHRCTTVLAR